MAAQPHEKIHNPVGLGRSVRISLSKDSGVVATFSRPFCRAGFDLQILFAGKLLFGKPEPEEVSDPWIFGQSALRQCQDQRVGQRVKAKLCVQVIFPGNQCEILEGFYLVMGQR